MTIAIMRIGYSIYEKDSKGTAVSAIKAGNAYKVIEGTTLKDCDDKIKDFLRKNNFDLELKEI